MSDRPRIVSMLPSTTEMVASLGFAGNLVGRSHECDHPSEVSSLPVVTAPAFEPEGSSREIDARVKERLTDALSVYRVEEDVLAALSPDVIVTQSQCEVCAVSLSDVEKAVRDRLSSSVRVVSVAAETIQGIWEDIEAVAGAIGATEAAGRLIATSTQRIEAIREQAASAGPAPGVVAIEWLDPPMAAGNWMPELIEAAGGRSLLAHHGSASPWISWQDVAGADPDTIVVIPCGFSIERTMEEVALLHDSPGWNELRAVREGRVFVADGNQYFNRPGPRIVESVEIMAEMLHPGAFSFGHEGRGWKRL